MFTALGLAALWMLLVLLVDPVEGGLVHPQWRSIGVCLFIGCAVFAVLRAYRRWTQRPRWLVPLSVVVVLFATGIAFAPFSIRGSDTSSSTDCVAVVDLWHDVVPSPSASDWQLFESWWFTLPPPLTATDPAERRRQFAAQREAAIARTTELEASPGFQRAYRYITWQSSQEACAPQARRYVAASGVVLVGGLAALTTIAAIRRRRPPNQRQT
jgi:hypothetical protein